MYHQLSMALEIQRKFCFSKNIIFSRNLFYQPNILQSQNLIKLEKYLKVVLPEPDSSHDAYKFIFYFKKHHLEFSYHFFHKKNLFFLTQSHFEMKFQFYFLFSSDKFVIDLFQYILV